MHNFQLLPLASEKECIRSHRCIATKREMEACQRAPACISAFSARCRDAAEGMELLPHPGAVLEIIASVQTSLGQSSKQPLSPASEACTQARGPVWAPAAHNRLSPSPHPEAFNHSPKAKLLAMRARALASKGTHWLSVAPRCPIPLPRSGATVGALNQLPKGANCASKRIQIPYQTAGAGPGNWLAVQGRQAARATTPTPCRQRAKARSRPRLHGIKRCLAR